MVIRSGHLPGHIRDTFIAAIEAHETWKPGEPEPAVEYEVKYVPRRIPISRACGLVWNCSDILPGFYVDILLNCGLDMKSGTYAAAARAMLPTIHKAR